MKHANRPVHLAIVLPGLIAAVLLLSVSVRHLAADQVAPETAQPAGSAGVPAAPTEAKDKTPKRFPDLEEVIKDMTAQEGLFTLYRFDPSDKKRDPEKLLAKIPHNLLDEDLLFAMSISRGPMAGWMWGDHLVRWQVAGNHLKLLTPDVRYTRPAGAPISEAVERTYNPTFLTAVPILAMSPQGDVVIDLGALLKSELAGVQPMGGRVRPELSTWTKVKVFPDNLLIDVDLALSGGQGGNVVGVSYAFRRLPKLGSYNPRPADARVGYFLTVKVDWSKKPSERETFDRYINRWKLEKRDPSLDLSPPKEPIVFIIEKTVPIQWRRWVREGIQEWNRAFEKIGFVDAIVVQQQTEDNEYANYDPEDARYNFFRWGVSGRAFAMGPSRVDPRTGQILDADIFFDDSFVRAWMYQFDLFGPAAIAQTKGPGFQEWLEQNPELKAGLFPQPPIPEPAEPQPEVWDVLTEKLQEHGRCTCNYAWGMQHQLALVYNALVAAGARDKKVPERLIGEAIREIVTHEVGHTLGLRHNFKASSWLPLEEILRRRSQTDEPTSASVMDYNPLLFFADDEPEKVRHFITPTLGPYDYWAIEYGYGMPQGKSEADYLKEIASRCTQPELQYATDEDAAWVNSPDPLVNRYDLSNDPIAYAQARAELTGKLLANITDWALQPGEPRYYLTRAYDVIWYERFRNLSYVARLVSGQYFHRDQHGDPDARPAFVPVEPQRQREALKFLSQTIFCDDFFLIHPQVLNLLAPSRWSHWGSNVPTRLDYPIHDRIRVMQVATLLDLMAPVVLQRVYDAELKTTGEDRFTAAELIRTLRDLVWHQLDAVGAGPYTDARPFISSLSRGLQQEYLFILLSIAQSRPGETVPRDVHAMICQAARELSERIGKVLEDTRLDFASRAHLTECRSRIDRVLTAQFQAR